MDMGEWLSRFEPGFCFFSTADIDPGEPPEEPDWESMELVSSEPWQVSDRLLLSMAESAQREVSRAQAQWLRLLGEVERRGASLREASLPTASWLAITNSHTVRSARADIALATGLERWPSVSTALAAGGLSAEQASVIVHGLERLPEDLDADRREAVAEQLVGFAAEFNPSGLRRLVNRAVEAVAPEVAEAADAAALERGERSQQRSRFLSWRWDVDGGLLLSGKLPAPDGELFVTHVASLAAKLRARDVLAGVETALSQAAADVLAQAVAHHATCASDAPPSLGTRVLVTLDYERLLGRLADRGLVALREDEPEGGAVATGRGRRGAILVASGEPVTPAMARRLACDAGIIPIVLGGDGQPLDLGREHRLFTGPQRAALAVRDAGCAFPACDRPVGDCEAHHLVPWWDGGRSDLSNAVLLCRHHHRLVEPQPQRPPERNWQISFDPHGKPLFAAPASGGSGTRIIRQHHRYRT